MKKNDLSDAKIILGLCRYFNVNFPTVHSIAYMYKTRLSKTQIADMASRYDVQCLWRDALNLTKDIDPEPHHDGETYFLLCLTELDFDLIILLIAHFLDPLPVTLSLLEQIPKSKNKKLLIKIDRLPKDLQTRAQSYIEKLTDLSFSDDILEEENIHNKHNDKK